MKPWQTSFFSASQSLWMVTAAMKLKGTCSLEEKLWKHWQHVKEQRHHFTNKGSYCQSYGFFRQSCMDVNVWPQRRLSTKDLILFFIYFYSVQFSHSVMSDSLRPHESQLARPPCPSPAPRVYSKLMSIESVMLCSHLFLCRSLLLLQSTGVSASASVLPMIMEANYFTIL